MVDSTGCVSHFLGAGRESGTAISLRHVFVFCADVSDFNLPLYSAADNTLEEAPLDPLSGEHVLRALVALQEQLDTWQACSRQMQAALAAMDEEATTAAFCSIHQLFNRLRTSYVRLRAHVVKFDRATYGDTIESYSELALRSQICIVETQLRRLPTLLDNASPHCMELSHMLTEVTAIVRLKLVLADAQWTVHRKSRPKAETASSILTDAQRVNPYHAGVVNASRMLNSVGSDRHVAEFLRAGTACQAPDVRAACSLVNCTLQLRVVTNKHELR